MALNDQAIAANIASSARPVVVTEARRAALVALLGGIALIYTVGFAQPEILHNAAHDTRHAMSFPCH